MKIQIDRLIIVSIFLCICRINIAQESKKVTCTGKVVDSDSDNYINGYVVAQRKGLAMGWSRWDMRKGSVELEIELSGPNALAGIVADDKALTAWMSEHKISFPAGIIQGDVEKPKSAWNVRSLPWLILTNKKHVVQSEGFAFSELDNKLKQSKRD